LIVPFLIDSYRRRVTMQIYSKLKKNVGRVHRCVLAYIRCRKAEQVALLALWDRERERLASAGFINKLTKGHMAVIAAQRKKKIMPGKYSEEGMKTWMHLRARALRVKAVTDFLWMSRKQHLVDEAERLGEHAVEFSLDDVKRMLMESGTGHFTDLMRKEETSVAMKGTTATTVDKFANCTRPFTIMKTVLRTKKGRETFRKIVIKCYEEVAVGIREEWLKETALNPVGSPKSGNFPPRGLLRSQTDDSPARKEMRGIFDAQLLQEDELEKMHDRIGDDGKRRFSQHKSPTGYATRSVRGYHESD
jgi:hypothetical protein